MDTIWIMMLPITVIALVSLFYPQLSTRQIERRMQEGGDSYLDEQRSYHAYPWRRNPRLVRLSGMVVLLLQAFALISHFYFR